MKPRMAFLLAMGTQAIVVVLLRYSPLLPWVLRVCFFIGLLAAIVVGADFLYWSIYGQERSDREDQR